MKKPKTYTTVVHTTRPDDFSVLRFDIQHVGDIQLALDELRRAVTEWGKTAEGVASYQNSSEDYNWGDMAMDLDCKKLQIGCISPVKLNRSIIKKIECTNIAGEFFVEHDEHLMSKWD